MRSNTLKNFIITENSHGHGENKVHGHDQAIMNRFSFLSYFKMPLALGPPFADFLCAIVCLRKKGKKNTFMGEMFHLKTLFLVY